MSLCVAVFARNVQMNPPFGYGKESGPPEGDCSSNYIPFTFFVGCSRTFDGESGVITSPNHPDNHPVSLDCSYLIRVPSGKTVTLSFSHFDLEPSESKLSSDIDGL